MVAELRRGLLFSIVTMALFGGAYHALLLGIGKAIFPSQAEGSLVRRSDGAVIGSRLLAQAFTRPEYFHPRPSAVAYNAASTGGTNYGPSNPAHLKAVRDRLDALRAADGVDTVPSEMITASGAGLDPHIPPNAADQQVTRVAGARGVDPQRVRALVRQHIEAPVLGIFGRARVNVLELNLALDASLGAMAR